MILFDALHKYIGKSKTTGGGFYVDIGAFDPIDISVTKAFSERGWRGINVEPLEKYFQALQLDRPNDINVKAVISDQKREVQLFEAAAASTVEQNTLRNIKRNNAYTGKVTIQAMTVDQLLSKYCLPSQTINFLKVDVEGHEEKVLLGMDFNKWRPMIIILESVVPWKGTPAYSNWEPILIKNSYIFAHSFRNNRYYVDSAFKDIKFRDMKDLMKDYRMFLISEPQNKYRLSYMAVESVFAEHPKLKEFVLQIIRKLYPIASKYFTSLIR